MEIVIIIVCIVVGLVLLSVGMSYLTASILFKRTMLRQEKLRDDLNNIADMDKWGEYMKILGPDKEWFLAQNTEHITIKSFDGLTLHADYLPAEKPSDKILLAHHGYTTNGISACSSIARFFNSMGYDCLVVDNRTHGKSEGEFVGFGILDRKDSINWMNYINERFEGKKDIVLYGVSMGGATVLMASGTEGLPDNVKAIIGDCGFTSPYDVFSHVLKANYHMPEFPSMKINNGMCKKKAGYGFNDYSTLTAMKTTKVPILFIHGSEDNFVPTWMSKKNYEECVSPKDILIVEGAGHASSYYENTELYQSKVKEFLEKNL